MTKVTFRDWSQVCGSDRTSAETRRIPGILRIHTRNSNKLNTLMPVKSAMTPPGEKISENAVDVWQVQTLDCGKK